MAEKRSAIVGDVLLLATLFAWCYYLSDSVELAIGITLPVFVFIKAASAAVKNHFAKKHPVSLTELYFRLGIMTYKEQSALFSGTMPEDITENFGNYFSVQMHEKTIIVACCFKLTAISADDLLRIKREIAARAVDKVLVLGRQPDRQTKLLAKRFGFSAEYPEKREVRKWLASRNAIPTAPAPNLEKEKNPYRLKDFLRKIFDKRKSKFYTLTALTLGITAFLVPLTAYYLTVAAIAATLAAGSLFTVAD